MKESFVFTDCCVFQDEETTRDCASMLLQEHQEKQRQIQTKRLQEKEKMNEKLRQKLLRAEKPPAEVSLC